VAESLPSHEAVLKAKAEGGERAETMLRRLRRMEVERRSKLREVENLVKALGYPV
jgi:hypothetical protein